MNALAQTAAEQAKDGGGIAAVWQVLVGLGAGSLLAKAFDSLLGRRKGRAETDSMVVKTANDLLSTMRQDLIDMRARLSEMDHRLSEAEDLVDAYRRRVIYLTDVVRQNNITIEEWSAPK